MKKISLLILLFMSLLLSAEKINLKDAIKKGIKISNESAILNVINFIKFTDKEQRKKARKIYCA